MNRFAEFLSEEQAQEVHEASLQILAEVGMLVRNARARARFARHGCQVDEEKRLVRFPPAVVEEWRAAFPPTFTFHGRDPATDRTIPGDGPLISTGSAAPDVVDPITGQVRRSRSDDIARIAHLVNELPGYDLLTVCTTADDAPRGQWHLSRYYPALKNCAKPVACSSPMMEEAPAIELLGALIAGSEAAYRARPFMTPTCCPVVSPLILEAKSTEVLMHWCEERLPFYVVGAPNAGMTSPMTLLGTVTQCNAEFLAVYVLAQMSQPGTPVIYANVPTAADMRTGAYAPGGIETGMLTMAGAQMARFYGVPSAGLVGLTNAKLNDAQAGFEMGMSPLVALMGGTDLLNMACLLDALMTFDFGTAVIGSEIGQMLKQVARGVPFDEGELALDVIADVGPGGAFVDAQHTLEHLRTATFLPTVADRHPRGLWEAAGARDAHDRAMQKAREILSRDNPAVFSPDVDGRIRAEFEGMVGGDAALEWPLGTAAALV